MTDKGRVVPEIPRPGRGSASQIDWDTPARLARLSGQPVLAGRNIRETLVKSLRLRKRHPFIDDTGHIAVKMRNSTINDEDGLRYGDVYLEWTPNTPTEGQ